MKIGFIGMGKMGFAMCGRLVDAGHQVVGFDVVPAARERAAQRGITPVDSLTALRDQLEQPRVVWVQAPPGEPTNSILAQLGQLLEAGDLVVEGGNSDFRDSLKNAAALAEKGITMVDAGVSGGVKGAREGCGLLVGAEPAVFERLRPVFEALAAPGGAVRAGNTGAGHYAKMIHNGVEYALMEAYAEGYEMLRASDIDIDVLATMKAYQNGCSIRSELLSKMVEALEPDVNLEDVVGYVADSGMGRWTLEESIRLKVPAPAIAVSLQARFRSQQQESPAAQSLAALRGTIGGHPVKRKGEL